MIQGGLRRRTLATASGIATVASVVGAVPGFLIPIAVAYFVGANSDTDAFFLALSVATLIANTFGATLQQAAIPFFVRAARVGEDIGALASQASTALVGSGMLTAFLLSVAVLTILRQSGWPAVQADFVRELIWLLAPFMASGIVAGVYGSVLNSEHRYVVVAASPAVRSAFVLLAALVAARVGVQVLALGYATGELVRLAWLRWLIKRRHRVSLFARPHGAVPRGLAGTAITQVMGAGILALLPVMDRVMASWLPPGSVSLLDYADRLWQVPMMLAMSGFMAVSLTHWSERFQLDQNFAALRRRTARLTVWSLAVSVPLCVGLGMVAFPVVNMLFGAGRFTGDELLLLSRILTAFVWGIPTYIAGLIYTRVFLVVLRSDVLLGVAVVEVLLKGALNAWFMSWWGVVGIAAATSVTFACACALLVAICHWWLRAPDKSQ